MLKLFINKLKSYFAAREFHSHIAKTDLDNLKYWRSLQVERESHETYKLGEFTAKVMSSKGELETRKILSRVNRDKQLSEKKEQLTKIAFDYLVKMDE